MPKFDAIVIGTGQAGPPLARRLVAAGRKVAVIERGNFGGTCVNNGCTPTKAMVASAYAAHLARRHADYGVTIGGPIAVDMKAVKARKDAIVAPSRNGVERSLKDTRRLHGVSGPWRVRRAQGREGRRDRAGGAIRSSSTSAGVRPCRRCPDSIRCRISPMKA